MTTGISNEHQVRELIEKWAHAVRARNVPAILSHHSAQILLFDVPPPLQSRGIDEYRSSWENVFYPWYGPDGEFELDELTITAGDDVAFCHGIIHCAGTEAGMKTRYDIRLTMGLKKMNGQWTIMHEHHSAPLE